jgi:hypothetical protein
MVSQSLLSSESSSSTPRDWRTVDRRAQPVPVHELMLTVMSEVGSDTP